jgi:HEAT repeat protein
MMGYGEITRMQQERDVKGLFSVLESSDKYARRLAVEALCAFCEPDVEEKLSEVKFKDPDYTVRRAAARGHERMVMALREQGRL